MSDIVGKNIAHNYFVILCYPLPYRLQMDFFMWLQLGFQLLRKGMGKECERNQHKCMTIWMATIGMIKAHQHSE
jgi:hypothetical protein